MMPAMLPHEYAMEYKRLPDWSRRARVEAIFRLGTSRS